MANSSLGIRRIEAIHYYVHDLERSRRFYTTGLDFREVAASGEALTARGRQRSVIFEADLCRVVCSTPVGEGGRAFRFLQKHPDGVGSIVFEVADVAHTLALLEERGGTPITDIETAAGPQGRFKTFVIATAFGDTTFRFVEREGNFPLYPGFDLSVSAPASGGANSCGFSHLDHVTTNFETMSPALLWMEHVMGFKRFWQVQFHTDQVTQVARQARLRDWPRDQQQDQQQDRHDGSGLKSVVMWDPDSGVKFANNEPQRPSFKASQINVFHEEHRGDGVQHVALGVRDIIGAVRSLRQRGIEFMSTPKTYYQALPARLQALRIGELAESTADLEELEVLVDGDGPGQYLLQIFLKDSAGLYRNAAAGPFFYEIIQRRGDDGFGAGNFRALFESIERDQVAEGKS